ncbi:MAG: hypothetical protein KVP17_003147, partial [Porospora cf. gigantea B]
MGSTVVEMGSHAELMATPESIYSLLVKAQSLATDEDATPMSRARSLSEMASQSVVSRMSSKYVAVSTTVGQEEVQEGEIVEELKGTTFQDPPNVRPTRVWAYSNKFDMVIAILGSMVAGAVWPVYAVVMSKFLALFYYLDPQMLMDEMPTWCYAFIGLAAACFVGMFLQSTFFEKMGASLTKTFRAMTFSNIIHQDIGFFDNSAHNTGALSELMASDCITINSWANTGVGVLLQNLGAIIVALFISFSVSWKLTLVTLAGFVILVPASVMEMKVLASTTKESNKEGSSGFLLNEVIVNVKTVKAFGLQQVLGSEYTEKVNHKAVSGYKKSLASGFAWGFSQFGQYAGQIIAYWYGSRLMKSGEIADIADLNMGIMALMMAAMGIGQSSILLGDTAKAKVAAARVFWISDRKPDVDVRDAH